MRGNSDSVPLPACCARVSQYAAISVIAKAGLSESRCWSIVPERLAEPKWMSRCRIEGLDAPAAGQAKRTSGGARVYAFQRLSFVQIMAPGRRGCSGSLGRRQGGKSGKIGSAGNTACHLFPKFRPRFHLNQLREASEFLAAGYRCWSLLMIGSEKQIDVPAGEGWTFQMAAGAVRLAIRYRAELIPFVLIDEGRWHFQIKLGRPVPAEYLAAGVDWAHAGKHLLNEMLPHFRNHPQQYSRLMAGYFRPPSPVTAAGKTSG